MSNWIRTALFRPQAVEFQKTKLHGDVLVTPSNKTWFIVSFLVFWTGGLVTLLLSGEFGRKVTVQGWVEPDLGVATIYPENGRGKVKQIFVAEGDLVTQGQPLMLINGDRVLANGEHLEEQLLLEYRKQQRMLNERLERAELRYQIKLNTLRNKKSLFDQDLGYLEAQNKLLTERLQLVKSKVTNYQQMHELGHLTRTDLTEAQEQVLSLQSDIENLKRQKLQKQNEYDLSQQELSLLPSEYRDLQDEITNSLSELARQIALVNGDRAYVIKSTKEGRVTAIQIAEGQYTRANVPLMHVVPLHAKLIAKLVIPTSSSGFVQSQQLVEVRYNAFPYQKFGNFSAKINEVSSSVILPSELRSYTANLNEPAFIASAELASETISAYGKEINLKPGMLLTADIQLGNRTIIEWLFDPIMTIKGRL